jgi:hypothetical protein
VRQNHPCFASWLLHNWLLGIFKALSNATKTPELDD